MRERQIEKGVYGALDSLHVLSVSMKQRRALSLCVAEVAGDCSRVCYVQAKGGSHSKAILFSFVLFAGMFRVARIFRVLSAR